ncbi:MAG: glycosyltransferase, partial [Phycisphaerae bacterium]
AALENLPPRGQWRQEMKSTLGDINRPIALFLSRIHPKKGLDRLLPLWPAVLREHPELLLVIAGTGDPAYLAQIRELIQQHNLQNAVLLAGQLSGKAKWSALVDADVFILPSHQEGFSMAITEAMAARLPVVITRECNFDEVERFHTGVVVRDGDMAAFVRHVADLLADATMRASMARNGPELVRERFTWEATAEKLERLYQAMIANRNEIPFDLQL